MENQILFPKSLKTLGYILILPGLVLGYLLLFKTYNFSILSYKETLINISFLSRAAYGNFTDEVTMIMIIVGLYFIAFSKEKIEDELICRIRINALYWAVILNYLVYFIFTLYTLFDDGLFKYINLYNLFTPLLIFIGRFNYLLHMRGTTFMISSSKLLPHNPFKWIGITLVLICASVLLISIFTHIGYYIVISAVYGLMVGLFVFAYSHTLIEDELIIHDRVKSMFWAISIYYLIVIAEILFLYEFNFFNAMLYDVFMPLILFVIVWVYFRLKQKNIKEKAMEMLS